MAETAGLEPVCCGFKSPRPDQRIYFATCIEQAKSTNIAAEFRASQIKQALHAGVAQWKSCRLLIYRSGVQIPSPAPDMRL